jgi:hypothetical protein
MKKSPSKRTPRTTRSVARSSLIAPLTPVPLVLGGMISTLEGLVGLFERPINAEISQLIKLTTALRNEACGGARPTKKRK